MIVTYEAIDGNGVRKHDSLEALSVSDAVEQLRRQGLFVTHADAEKGSKSGSVRAPKKENARLPLRALVTFTRQMAMLLRAGSGLVPAIQGIGRQMSAPGQKELLRRIVIDLEEGHTFSESLRKYPGTFDPVYCAIVAAGEASAGLPSMFERLASIVSKRRAMRNKIIGSLAYPGLLILMSLNIVSTLMFFVLPRFGQMFTQLGAEVPQSTQLLLSLGEGLRDNWMAVVGFLAASIVGAVIFLLSKYGKQWMIDVQLQIPLLGKLRSKLIQGQVFRTMGMLLESKVGVLDTLELVRASTANRRYQSLFDQVESVVTSGGHLSTAFERSGLIEPYICQAIRTGEESGNLGGAMTYCADVLDETNVELINTIMRLIEPTILIGMGLMVGGVAISLFMPLFDLTSAMR